MNAKALLRLVPPWFALAVAWCALWADLSWGNLAGGLVAGVVLLALFRIAPVRIRGAVRPLALLGFGGWILVNLVRSSLLVAWEVLTPADRTTTGVLRVRVVDPTSRLVLVVSNSIGLTPGTMVIETREEPGETVLYVHVLHLRDLERVRADLDDLVARARRALGMPAVSSLDRGAP